MESRHLKESLEQVHKALAEREQVDEDVWELLRQIGRDVELLLERSETEREPHRATLAEFLRESVDQFEGSHPTLTSTLGRLADTLTSMGI